MDKNGKVPGASVRNKALYDPQGQEIGKILDVVFSPDHKRIEHGVIELESPEGGRRKLDISWDAVEFNEKGKASLRYDLEEDKVGSMLRAKKSKKSTDKVEVAAEVDYFDNRLTPK